MGIISSIRDAVVGAIEHGEAKTCANHVGLVGLYRTDDGGIEVNSDMDGALAAVYVGPDANAAEELGEVFTRMADEATWGVSKRFAWFDQTGRLIKFCGDRPSAGYVRVARLDPGVSGVVVRAVPGWVDRLDGDELPIIREFMPSVGQWATRN